MKFKDLTTGNIVESENEFVIVQYKNYPDRYKEVKAKKKLNRLRRPKNK